MNTTAKVEPNYIFAYFSTLFTLIVIAGNIFASKMINIGSLSTPAGMICFPFSFSLGDIITELYGYQAAKKIIYFGLFNLLIFTVLLNVVIYLPASADFPRNQEFGHVFDMSIRFFIGTIGGYWASELLNSKVLSVLKYITSGDHFFPRSITSTIIGVTTDTVVFNLIAFAGVIPFNKLFPFIFNQYLLKVGFEIAGAFAANIVLMKMKKIEHSDVTDRYSYRWIDKYKKLYSRFFR